LAYVSVFYIFLVDVWVEFSIDWVDTEFCDCYAGKAGGTITVFVTTLGFFGKLTKVKLLFNKLKYSMKCVGMGSKQKPC
jgi:hypothetical protein